MMGSKLKGNDKFMSSVKVGPKGQIVIPKEVRDMFQINPGDTLLLLADAQKGIAIERYGVFAKSRRYFCPGKAKEIYPEHTEEDSITFARAIRETQEGGEDDESD